MTNSAPRAVLLAALLLAPAAFAQDAAPAADATPATPATPAVPAAPEAPTTPEAPVATETPAAAAAPAMDMDEALPAAVTAVVGTPPPGKGLVVFFRPKNFAGSAVGFIVRENDVELGKLRNANWFAVPVDPGMHTYVVHSEAKDVTNLDIEEGQTYFVSASVNMGFFAGRPNLTPSDVAAFQVALPKLKPSKPLR